MRKAFKNMEKQNDRNAKDKEYLHKCYVTYINNSTFRKSDLVQEHLMQCSIHEFYSYSINCI